jgi:hypothetical protein
MSNEPERPDFGNEKTISEIRKRIVWERWAGECAENSTMKDLHRHTLQAYTELLYSKSGYLSLIVDCGGNFTSVESSDHGNAAAYVKDCFPSGSLSRDDYDDVIIFRDVNTREVRGIAVPKFR